MDDPIILRDACEQRIREMAREAFYRADTRDACPFWPWTEAHKTWHDEFDQLERSVEGQREEMAAA